MAKSPETYTIGEVARQTGLRTSALRYYESVGVLPTPRRVSTHRVYDADIFRHVRFIQTAQKAGFLIEEIKTLLNSADTGTAYSIRLQELARRKLVDVEKLITDAHAMKKVLEAGLACRCAEPEDCLLFIDETDHPCQSAQTDIDLSERRFSPDCSQ